MLTLDGVTLTWMRSRFLIRHRFHQTALSESIYYPMQEEAIEIAATQTKSACADWIISIAIRYWNAALNVDVLIQNTRRRRQRLRLRIPLGS